MDEPEFCSTQRCGLAVPPSTEGAYDALMKHIYPSVYVWHRFPRMFQWTIHCPDTKAVNGWREIQSSDSAFATWAEANEAGFGALEDYMKLASGVVLGSPECGD